jgi:hypothetical protein
MSTSKSALNSRMASAATRRAEPDAPEAGKTAIRTKPARVTLNLPPSLMRDVEQWTVEAAATMDVPRVSVQDALRGMIRAAVLDKSIGLVVIDLLRRENSR